MLKSYCKINLSLRVLKKLKNGLHDIETNSLLISTHDTIKIIKIKKRNDKIIFTGKFRRSVKMLKNTVLETMKILRQKNIINKNKKYRIVVNKKIPAFSGLGGGTSNAVFILKYFFKKKINNSIINEFDKKIGSDFRIFLQKQAYQKSLKIFKGYKNFLKLYFVIVYPNIKCSTKSIYSKVKNYSKNSKIDPTKIKTKDRFISFLKREKNDLQDITVSKFSKLNLILNFISIQKDCYFSRMTGSGSACFGMFKSKKSAIAGLKIIKTKFPKYWCVFAKTI
tara:strand:+ start:730 stop:1569 length:840 start_codon:yes stop_codon:yes gene_type:complete